MKALCFQRPQEVAVEEIPDPVLESATDAIVKVDTAGLCGSDLHPFFGREEGLDPGTAMGHEFVGRITEVGSDVTKFRTGDRVCAPFTTNCGWCHFCEIGLTSRCLNGELFGWRSNGIGLHGGQAEYVRVPLADTTLVRVPDHVSDDAALLVGDNLSTAIFCNDLADVVGREVYAVIGCGTVGLLAVVEATRRGATVFAFDPNASRAQEAARLGAHAFNSENDFEAQLRSATKGLGAKAVMEVVGLSDAQKLAYDIVRPGGTIATIGCHCSPHFAFRPSDVYDKNLTYRSGRCPARAYMEPVFDRIDEYDLDWCITHSFPLNEAVQAYDLFSTRPEGVRKVTLSLSTR